MPIEASKGRLRFAIAPAHFSAEFNQNLVENSEGGFQQIRINRRGSEFPVIHFG